MAHPSLISANGMGDTDSARDEVGVVDLEMPESSNFSISFSIWARFVACNFLTNSRTWKCIYDVIIIKISNYDVILTKSKLPEIGQYLSINF